jgi:hypothetical protein
MLVVIQMLNDVNRLGMFCCLQYKKKSNYKNYQKLVPKWPIGSETYHISSLSLSSRKLAEKLRDWDICVMTYHCMKSF